MKVCLVCGEASRRHPVPCLAHDVPLRPWNETSTDTPLEAVTDVDGHAQVTDTPHGVLVVAKESRAPWPTPAPLAETPPVPGEDDPGRARAPGPGRLLGDRYRLSRQLGIGGYGAVFAAVDRVTGERVAIKVLTPAASQCAEMITRFYREAIAASRARHPHIVDVADFGVDDDGRHYLVMEHLAGSDLAEVLAGARRLPPARALVIAAQCARGLAAAHRVGVLHRDLKPANVFLVWRTTGDESVKIIDFGISKLTRAAGDYTDVTSASHVVGTPCYMSPEQARGATLDERTDVYALGVMLFEMLVGDRPFTGRSPIEILAKHRDAPRVSPSARRPELAACPGLDALVLRALAAAPAGRFRSMEEFGEAILACLCAIDPAAARHATEITGELVEPRSAAARAAPPRRPGLRPLGLALAATALATLAVAWWPRGGGNPLEDDPAMATARSATPAPPLGPALVVVPVPVPVLAAPTATSSPAAGGAAPRPAGRRQRVTLTSTPAGATVRRDGDTIGVTPLQLDLEPEGDPVVLTLAAAGHRDRRVVVGPDQEVVEAVLERAPRRGARPGQVARPGPAGSAALGVEEW
jgi:eukaryotic-like serine/threonine-protein kinase